MKRPTKPLLWFFRLLAALATIVSMAIFVPWPSVIAYLKPLPDSVQQQVDDAVRSGLDGVIVYIDRPGSAPGFYAAGWKDRENRIPADPHALFKIASISKLYIAAATAMLASDGQLDLDRTLSAYLPEYRTSIANADRITLRMLVQHRSGIPDWVDDPEFPWETSFDDVDQYLQLVLNDPADFEPGSQYDYSNTNYLLIGKILDNTLGYDHQRYIRERILQPLGLNHTFGLLVEADLDKVMSGYHSGNDSDLKWFENVCPGGSMVATAEDVGIFLRALNDGSLFTDNERAIYSSLYGYEHTGEWPGYSSIAKYHKDIDAVVIEFFNSTGGNSWLTGEIVYNRIVRILHQH